MCRDAQVVESVTTTLQLKNLPTNITDNTVVASVQTITSDTDTTPTVSPYTGQPLTLPAHSIMLVTIKNLDAPELLDRRHSLGETTTFLATMPMINRDETSCSSTKCSLPALHYAAYDAVRSSAYLGIAQGGTVARTAVTYQNLPTAIYANGMHYNRIVAEGDITITATVAGCSASLPFTLTDRTTQTIDFSALDQMCGFATKAKPITLTFALKGTHAVQTEIYLSASKSEADKIAASISRYNMLAHPL